MQYIGKIDLNKIGEYSQKVITYDVVLTDERKKHIYEMHNKDYELIMRHISKTILHPTEIIKDLQHDDTLFFIRQLRNNHLNVVIKLNVNNNKQHPKNSIMTAFIIRNKNLYKLRKKNSNFP